MRGDLAKKRSRCSASAGCAAAAIAAARSSVPLSRAFAQKAPAQGGDVLQIPDAARGNEVAGDRPAKRLKLIEIRPLEGAVPRNIGENKGAHPQILHPPRQLEIGHLRDVQPALGGNHAVYRVNAHRDLIAVGRDRLPHKGGVFKGC